MARRLLSCVLVLGMVLGRAWGADADRATLAVLDFSVNSVSEADMRSVISLLSSALFETRSYTVVDIRQRDALLKEVEFSVQDCTDEGCQIEIGRMLAAEVIVVGDIAKVGTRFILSAKMLDTASGATLGTASRVYRSMDALVRGLQAVATRLARSASASGAGGQRTAFGAARAPRISLRAIAGIGLAAAGVGAAAAGGYLLYSAMAVYRNDVRPTLSAYESAVFDLSLSEQQNRSVYDALWDSYSVAYQTYRTRLVLGSSIAGIGVVAGAGGTLLLSLPAGGAASTRGGIGAGMALLPAGIVVRVAY